jgi:hypothetical protein
VAPAYLSSENAMKNRVCFVILVCVLLMVVTAGAQNPNYNNGPIWRVTYVHINPGMGDAFWKDIHDHLKPIWDAQKQAGILSDYKLYVNPVTDSADDWSIAIALLYPSWAGLDTVDSKAATISVQHYGSREAMMEAAKKRAENGHVVASKLAREVMAK